MEIKIRSEGAKDIDQVRAILEAAFPTEADSKLVDTLRTNGKASLSLVPVDDEQVLGHILFSPVTATPSSAAKGIGLAPLAVHPKAQSRGIGAKLSLEGLRRCQ